MPLHNSPEFCQSISYVPFDQRGGRGKVYQLFGNELVPLLDELNKVLAA